MSTWLGPPLCTLRQPDFDAACAELMRLVEADYRPTLLVGIRTGGLIVAQSMTEAVSRTLPVLPVTSRRVATGVKSRLPFLRSSLAALPQPVIDVMRRVEHRVLIAPRARQTRAQSIDRAEVEAIGAWIAAAAAPVRMLVTDDAVDSGVTLATVLHHLREVCPGSGEIRSAVITQTLDHPMVQPDYVLSRNILYRFPWSFDAAS